MCTSGVKRGTREYFPLGFYVTGISFGKISCSTNIAHFSVHIRPRISYLPRFILRDLYVSCLLSSPNKSVSKPLCMHLLLLQLYNFNHYLVIFFLQTYQSFKKMMLRGKMMKDIKIFRKILSYILPESTKMKKNVKVILKELIQRIVTL